MRYSAKLLTPVPEERPKQVLGSSRGSLDHWAKAVLATAPEGSEVVIYESRETELTRYAKDAAA